MTNTELIAEFMGYEKVRVGYFGDTTSSWGETEWQLKNRDWLDKMKIDSVGDYGVSVANNEYFDWSDCAYDTSWDWLMPVCQKLMTLLKSKNTNDTNFDYRVQCNFIRGDIERVIWNYCYSSGTICEIYKELSKAIKWYNEHENKKTK